MTFLHALLDDLVKLKMPVTAAAIVATVLALVEPFGISLNDIPTDKVTAALVAVGVIAAYVQRKLGGIVVKTNPATIPGAADGVTLPADGTVREATIGTARPGERGNPQQPRAPGA